MMDQLAFTMTSHKQDYIFYPSSRCLEMYDDILQDENDADNRIAKSYMSPKMQHDVLYFMNSPYAINITTQEPVFIQNPCSCKDGMPTVKNIIDKMHTLKKSFLSVNKTAVKRALDSTIIAVELAIIVIKDEIQYLKRENSQLTEKLSQLENIQTLLYAKQNLVKQETIKLLDSLQDRTYDEIDNDDEATQQKINFENIKVLTGDELANYLNQYNYQTFQDNPTLAANLLVYQCFMAQNYHTQMHPLSDTDKLNSYNILITTNPTDVAMTRQLATAIEMAIFIVTTNLKIKIPEISEDRLLEQPIIQQLITWKKDITTDAVQTTDTQVSQSASKDANTEIVPSSYFDSLHNIFLAATAIAAVIGGAYYFAQHQKDLTPQRSALSSSTDQLPKSIIKNKEEEVFLSKLSPAHTLTTTIDIDDESNMDSILANYISQDKASE